MTRSGSGVRMGYEGRRLPCWALEAVKQTQAAAPGIRCCLLGHFEWDRGHSSLTFYSPAHTYPWPHRRLLFAGGGHGS